MSKKIVIGIVLVLILAVGGGLVTSSIVEGKLSSKIGSVNLPSGTLSTSAPLPQNFLDALSTPSDGTPVNILLLGSDSRNGDNSQYGDPTVFDTARSDTTMLIHLSGDRTHVTVMSVPRDLWVRIPACTLANGELSKPSDSKFNSAYSLAGAGCTVKTFTSITNIPINHVVEVDFTGFKKIVDTIGGIDVCVQKPIDDPNAHITLPAGQYTVNGEQALGLARARYTLGDGSDISRIQRQQILVKSMILKIKSSATVTDPSQLYRVLSDTLDSISTDENLKSLPAIATLAWQSRNISQKDIEFITVPYIDRNDGSTVGLDTVTAKKLFNSIIQDSRSPSGPTSASPDSSANPSPNSSGTPANPSPSPTTPLTQPRVQCTITPIN